MLVYILSAPRHRVQLPELFGFSQNPIFIEMGQTRHLSHGCFRFESCVHVTHNRERVTRQDPQCFQIAGIPEQKVTRNLEITTEG